MKKRKRLLFLLLACLLVVVAAVLAARRSRRDAAREEGATATPMPAAVAAAQPVELSAMPLEVKGGVVQEVGDIFVGERREVILTFVSTSEKEWKPDSIEASCSCTNVTSVPDNLVLRKGSEWRVPVRIDSTRISAGEFTRKIVIYSRAFQPLSISFHGVVRRFYDSNPATRILKFPGQNAPDQPWKVTGIIQGADAGEKVLELEEPQLAADSFLKAELEKIAAGHFMLTVSPRRPLPFKSDFSETVTLRVRKPEGMPPIIFTVSGRVGMSLRFQPAEIVVKPEDFAQGGVVRKSTMLGFDPKDYSYEGKKNEKEILKMRSHFVENVDWDALFQNFAVKAPAGITAKPFFTRFGLRLKLEIAKSAFAEEKSLVLPATAFGNPLATLRIRLAEQPPAQ